MRTNDVGSGEDHRRSGSLADELMGLETTREHLVKRVPLARGDECVGSVQARLWVLASAGKDPAFGSGPVATIIQDVRHLLIYFMVVRLLVM
jgi:hypothetical protein